MTNKGEAWYYGRINNGEKKLKFPEGIYLGENVKEVSTDIYVGHFALLKNDGISYIYINKYGVYTGYYYEVFKFTDVKSISFNGSNFCLIDNRGNLYVHVPYIFVNDPYPHYMCKYHSGVKKAVLISREEVVYMDTDGKLYKENIRDRELMDENVINISGDFVYTKF